MSLNILIEDPRDWKSFISLDRDKDHQGVVGWWNRVF
jgi:hypothetical protein